MMVQDEQWAPMVAPTDHEAKQMNRRTAIQANNLKEKG